MTTPPIVIRPATADDLTQMSALWYEKIVMLSQQDRRWALGEHGRADWERQAATWLGDERCVVRVAAKPSPASETLTPRPPLPQGEGGQYSPQENEFPVEVSGVVVGYAVGWVQDAPPGMAFEKMGLISDVAIDAHGYHAGTARGLVEALRAWFGEQGVTQVVASVPKRDAIGQAFWRAYGAAEWMEWLWIKS